MEGLLPLVFKAIKKNQTRRRYECLSSGAAQSYNVADCYGNIGTTQNNNSVYMTLSAEKNMQERYSHRRHKSVGDFYVGYSSANGGSGGGGGSPPPMQKQLVRFRSHRMFSCVTGGS